MIVPSCSLLHRESSTLIHIDAVRDRINLMEHYEEMKRKIKYAQSLTSKPVKGMLTGPVTNSPRVPTRNEMVDLLKKAAVVIPEENIWVNPDCGLKTRGWKKPIKLLLKW